MATFSAAERLRYLRRMVVNKERQLSRGVLVVGTGAVVATVRVQGQEASPPQDCVRVRGLHARDLLGRRRCKVSRLRCHGR